MTRPDPTNYINIYIFSYPPTTFKIPSQPFQSPYYLLSPLTPTITPFNFHQNHHTSKTPIILKPLPPQFSIQKSIVSPISVRRWQVRLLLQDHPLIRSNITYRYFISLCLMNSGSFAFGIK